MQFEILDKTFQVPLNKKVLIKDCITIRKGNIIGLWGANGIGKSTLLKRIYLEFSTNQFDIIKPFADYEKFKIGIIPQNINELIFPWLKVDKIIDIFQSNFFALNGNISISEVTNCSKKIRNLSGGEKQILALELILNFKFQVLFLDEPFSAMDFDNMRKYLKKLSSYAYENGAIIFIVVHDLLVLQNISDFFLIFSQKRNEVKPIKNNSKDANVISTELLERLYD